MELFIIILLLCLLTTLLPDFLRNYLKLSRFLVRGTGATEASFDLELNAAREEVENVRNAQHSGEYARTIKIMRAEQKVKDVEEKIKVARTMASIKQSGIDTIAYYASKVIMTIVLIIVSISNRGTPVMVFSETINLQPLGGLLSFPTGISNAVSVPVWSFSCNFTFRLLYGLIKNRA
ncbi:tail-anchored protein insertion receptor WRB [Scaptodrosophila lebanonensis]|uniref:Tail-anchored protein insertion receptor WRB n=1 Tax=Drosophila lebanonensis TaxID=7225 RepID=A0A6J2T8Z5_DROLE|nr:tail-anchored protein insertion receptor WRB [Scaptodrosophila lebanonensis]